MTHRSLLVPFNAHIFAIYLHIFDLSFEAKKCSSSSCNSPCSPQGGGGGGGLPKTHSVLVLISRTGWGPEKVFCLQTHKLKKKVMTSRSKNGGRPPLKGGATNHHPHQPPPTTNHHPHP